MQQQSCSPLVFRDFKRITLAIGLSLPLFCAGAFAAEAKASLDPADILEQMRQKARNHVSQLRNYTCHVVVDRLIQRTGSNSLEHHDRVEFEAAFVGERELFSRPGEGQFEEKPISSMVTDGMISNNAFGSHDDIVLSGDTAQYEYRGRCNKDGHNTYRYDFRVPLQKSQFLVRHNAQEAIVAYKGTVWVDADTLELIRLEWKTEHIPSFVGISSIKKVMHYDMLRIGNSSFLLPDNSELTAYGEQGDFSLNIVALKACREFTGESKVNYDTQHQ